MRNVRVLFVVAATLLSASPAFAQRGGGFGFGFGGLSLLGQKSVQQDLQLSDEQVQKADGLLAKERESFSALRDLSREERRQKFAERIKESRAALGELLDESQLKRLRQITLQQRGTQAIGDPEVADSLDLSDEQEGRVGEILSAAREEMRGLFQQGAGDRQERRQKFLAARDSVRDKLHDILTPKQQAKWKELLGKPFEGELRSPFGPNRGGDNPPSESPGDDASTGVQPPAAIGPFHLVSFNQDADDDDADRDDDKAHAKKPDAKQRDARKSHAKKAQGHKPEHRGRHAHRDSRRSAFSHRPDSQRERAWDHVARVMRERTGRPPMPHGPRHAVAGGPRHGHFGPMHWGRHSRPTFGPGPRHDTPSLAFGGHGWGPRHFSYAGYRGFGDRGHGRRFHYARMHHFGRHHGSPRWMAHHRGFPGRGSHHNGWSLAQHREFSGPGDSRMDWRGPFHGHHAPDMGRGHHDGGPHHLASRHHDGRRSDFAGHHGPPRMHMAGFHKHKHHGHARAGKPDDGDRSHRHGDRSSGGRHRRDRDDSRDKSDDKSDRDDD